ncbi:MAG: hypothetical protein JWO28_335, partial [Hyphomicrobiales bacterium]|nr:hypothetical protein [Hyphomicrobiales bacterium]
AAVRAAIGGLMNVGCWLLEMGNQCVQASV